MMQKNDLLMVFFIRRQNYKNVLKLGCIHYNFLQEKQQRKNALMIR